MFKDDDLTDESQAGVLPHYQPWEQRSETRSEVSRRTLDQVTTWRKDNSDGDKFMSGDHYQHFPPCDVAAARVNFGGFNKAQSPSFPQPVGRSAPMSNHFVLDYPPPRPVIPQFEGDPTEYLTFTKAFKTHIGDRGLSGETCLTYLLQHCSIKVRRRLEHFQSKPDGFSRAWHALYINYGQPHIVASCYEKELLSFPRISQDNRDALMDYSILFEKSLSAVQEFGEFASLNSLTTLKEIISKLPLKFRYDWTERAFQVRETTGRKASFRELVEFVAYKSEVMNSMYGKLDWSTRVIGTEKNVTTQRRKLAVLYTVSTKKGHSSRTGRYLTTMCLYC